ncbi:hypothetical protein IPN35_02325 [Candidatus Peregrinibacteria bacterium]|nr:MAG: hypothetical protein IPN35_02325 [Candidatus Peregrinibacteria bacterium]
MKRITQADLFATAERKHISSSAKAALVLQRANVFFQDFFSGDSSYICAEVWKEGVLFVSVESPAVAMKVYSASEDLLEILQKDFPYFRFREVRTRISGKI